MPQPPCRTSTRHSQSLMDTTNRKKHRRPTLLTRSGSFFEYILKTLAATSWP